LRFRRNVSKHTLKHTSGYSNGEKEEKNITNLSEVSGTRNTVFLENT